MPKKPSGTNRKRSFAEDLYRLNRTFSSGVPSMKETHEFVDDLVCLLFPIKENRNIRLPEMEICFERMKLRLKKLLIPLEKELEQTKERIIGHFFYELPGIFRMLMNDAETFLHSDPAARKIEEVILCYPGFYSLVVYRLAHML